ncbi:MAG TPA: hypothetical protein PKC24_08950, partial [Cyclobacteriaceae bacterium]|nr:hypothetical protein [Cyclobacteriaceae bacterium]
MTRILISLCLLCLAISLSAQRGRTPAQSPAPAFNAELYSGLKWRNIGPYRGGRSGAVSGVINNDQVYFVGYTGGGLWKTENAGISWFNISDQY